MPLFTSVHLQDFPDITHLPEEEALVADMDRVRDICNAALAVRNRHNIRVRQPLKCLRVYGHQVTHLGDYIELIKEELNVKEVTLDENVSSVADFQLKIHFPVLGKRLPEKMKEIITASKGGAWKTLNDGSVEIAGERLHKDECELLLQPKAKEQKEEGQNAQPLSSNDALVILDTTITESLRQEGVARDLVRLIQESRKQADLEISDRIALYIVTEGKDLIASCHAFTSYIKEQTLTDGLTIGSPLPGGAFSFIYELEGEKLVIGIEKRR